MSLINRTVDNNRIRIFREGRDKRFTVSMTVSTEHWSISRKDVIDILRQGITTSGGLRVEHIEAAEINESTIFEGTFENWTKNLYNYCIDHSINVDLDALRDKIRASDLDVRWIVDVLNAIETDDDMIILDFLGDLGYNLPESKVNEDLPEKDEEGKAKHDHWVMFDFDGVCARYDDGWQGEEVIGDPIPGVAEFIKSLRDRGLKCGLYTCRQVNDTMTKWLADNGFEFDSINSTEHNPEFSNKFKPVASLYVDDNAVRFNPNDPEGSMAEIKKDLEISESISEKRITKPFSEVRQGQEFESDGVTYSKISKVEAKSDGGRIVGFYDDVPCTVKEEPGMNEVRYSGPAYRVETGSEKHPDAKTAADVIRHERDELGNDLGVSEEKMKELESIPATDIIWVTRSKIEARHYGQDIQDYSKVVAGGEVISEIGPDGVLVVKPRKVAAKVSIDDTGIDTWFERDRQYVGLKNKKTGDTIIEWWDEDVSQAVEDGFLDPKNYHQSAYDYAVEHGMMKESVNEEIKSTNKWPDDFQVILFDYLEPLGYDVLPDTISTKLVPVDEYIEQAKKTGYDSGDSRRHPEYLADLKSFSGSGNELPPIIVNGNKLVDGRHRILVANSENRKSIEAIDLKDLKPINEKSGYDDATDTGKLDEKEKYFIDRTNKHIGLVKSSAEKLVGTYPEYKELLQVVEKHDASKFEEPERTPYIEITWRHKAENEAGDFDPIKDKGYKKPGTLPAPEENEATVHHITTNKHHPEYYVKDKSLVSLDPKDRDKGGGQVLDASDMPDIAVAEMVCDWQAMTDELKKNTTREWFDKQKDTRWHFSDKQMELINKLISVFEGGEKPEKKDTDKVADVKPEKGKEPKQTEGTGVMPNAMVKVGEAKHKHKHVWVDSTNETCPYCGGGVEYCEDVGCYLYKCKNPSCKRVFKVKK